MEDNKVNYTDKFKAIHIKKVEERIESIDFDKIDKDDTVSLYHGTSSYYLNGILEKGILNRGNVKNNNWEHVPSVKNMAYLTNKWHYIYAFGCAMNLFEKGIIKNNYPAYIECKIPKELLEIDEDFFHSKYVYNKLKRTIKKNENFELDWQESLSQFGTVGVLGNIPLEYIKSFTILGDIEHVKKVFTHENCQYQKDFQKWCTGKGKGKLRLKDLLVLEAQSDKNGTWWLKDIPKGAKIHEIFENLTTNKISIRFEHS